MKITLIVNSDIGKHGKIGTRTFYISKKLLETNSINQIFCRGVFTNEIDNQIILVPPFLRYLSLLNRALGIYLIPEKMQNFSSEMILKYFDNFISNRLNKCDILHSWEMLPKSFLKAKHLGTKVVLDIQMAPLYYDYKEENLLPIQKFNHYKKYVDFIFAPSRFIKEILIKEYNYTEDQIFYIPFGVDISKFKPDFNKKSSDKITFLFVGLLKFRKGVHYLIKAWGDLNLPDAELIFCGRISKEIKDFLKQYKHLKNITFKNHINDQEKLIKEYQKADVFVFPSIIEGSAKVTYEAMACGLPVITTPNAGSVVRDGVDGFIIPALDENSIKEKILYFYNNPHEIKRMGENAYRYVQIFSWENYANTVINAYKNILCKS